VPRRALGEGPRCERLTQYLAGAGGAQPLGPCPKGLRYGFGVQAVSRDIAANMMQRRLGNARLTTTAVHENAVGEKERSSAARMW
jgi:integrase/recombinase XerD